MNDPLKSLRRRILFGRAAVLLIIAPALVWALSDVRNAIEQPASPDDDGASPAEIEPPGSPIGGFNADAFAVRLWNPPPPPVTATAAGAQDASPPMPPKVQLVGIISESGALYAALYDLTADKLLVLATGQSIQDFTVESITDEHVVLTNGRVQHELRIRENRS